MVSTMTTHMVDALLQHEVERQAKRMVEKVRGQEIRQEVVGMAKGVVEVAKDLVKMAKKVIMVVEEVVEITKQMEVGNVRTINNGRGGCSYKEFMACNPKDYDGNVRDDNKRSRTGRAFAITKNLVREYTIMHPNA
ncbi:hypothetical protein Tco_0797694 [Tanacetum coccineum]